jgi:DNA modification methylase
MQIELRPIDSITPYENNPRQNDDAVDAVAQSIKEFGWQQPIVVDEQGVIVVGHTRWKAAKKLGMSEVPVHVASGLTPAQLRAYRIADNQTNTLSSWDDDKLMRELMELQKEEIDLDVTGFTSEDLQRLTQDQSAPALTDPDAIPDPPDQALTQRGDLWELEDHRLLCGDSAKMEDVDRLINGAPIHLVNTDPPYGVKVEPRSNNAIAAGNSSFEQRAKKPRTHHQSFDVARQGEKQATHQKLRAKDRPLENDFLSEEEYSKLLHLWFGNLTRVLEPGRSFYIWGGYANVGNYPPVLKAMGLYFSQAIIWHKMHPVLTRKDYMGDHEWCFYGWKEGKAHQFFGPNNATDVWDVKKINPQSMIHLTEKPVELAARAIQYSSQPGENVLDLFAGSGSTLIACEQLHRKAFLMEIDPLYCDIIVERWCAFTGKKAIRIDKDGNKFPYQSSGKQAA